MVFCFSGTGNSRYIANRIATALQDEVVDLNARIKASDHSPVRVDGAVVVVSPTYAWRLPRIVTDWLLETELSGARRVWYVMDCGGEIGDADRYNRRVSRLKRLEHMGTAQIIMPENYIAMFDAPQVPEAQTIVDRAEPAIDEAVARIRSGEPFDAPRGGLAGMLLSGPVNPLFYRLFVKADAFRTLDSCTGCGGCARRCPLNNIEIRDGRPVWGARCTHCMACICHCPAEAVEYGAKSVGKPRYRFEQLGR